MNLKNWYEEQGSRETVNTTYESSKFGTKHFFQRRFKKVVKHLRNVRGLRICEIGCGSGYYTKYLASKGARVWAIDISQSYVENAQKLLNSSKLSNRVKFINSDASNLSFKAGLFDLVLCSEVLEHTKKPFRVLKEIKRILRPGGKIVLSFPNKWSIDEMVMRIIGLVSFNEHIAQIESRELERWLTQNGLLITKEKNTVFGYWIFNWMLNSFPRLIKPFSKFENFIEETPYLQNLCWSKILLIESVEHNI